MPQLLCQKPVSYTHLDVYKRQAQDYTAINPEFGNLEDFKNLVNEAHKMGFKVIIDWVANHTGWDHVWTKTHPEYYIHDADAVSYTHLDVYKRQAL